jgi:hypothetical protein
MSAIPGDLHMVLTASQLAFYSQGQPLSIDISHINGHCASF